MKLYLLLPVFLPVFASCQQNTPKNFAADNILLAKSEQETRIPVSVTSPAPTGYARVPAADHSSNK